MLSRWHKITKDTQLGLAAFTRSSLSARCSIITSPLKLQTKNPIIPSALQTIRTSSILVPRSLARHCKDLIQVFLPTQLTEVSVLLRALGVRIAPLTITISLLRPLQVILLSTLPNSCLLTMILSFLKVLWALTLCV